MSTSLNAQKPAGGGGDDDGFDLSRPPVRGFFGEHPIPDLSQIPRRHWRTVLACAHPSTHPAARAGLEGKRQMEAAVESAKSLLQRPDRAVRPAVLRAAAFPRSIPSIDIPPAGGGPARQVNFRVSAAEYADLEAVARLLSVRTTAAARLLAMRGVAQVLRESEGQSRS